MPGVKRKAGFSRVIVKAGRRRAFPARAHLASMATEVKYHDSGTSSGNLVTNTDATAGERDPAVELSLNSIAQGTGDQERDGRRITITHVRVQGFIREDEVGTPGTLVRPPQQYFVALVLDKQTNGAQLKSEEVFTNLVGTTNLGTDLMANLKFSKRFSILGMKRLRYANDAAISASVDTNGFNGVLTRFTFDKRLRLPVLYSESDPLITSIVDNSLHVIAFCLDTSVTTPKLAYAARIRFVG